MVLGFVAIGALAVGGAYAVTLFNGLVRLKHGAGKNWSNIDVILKQRNEELPKIVEVCRQYMNHERETLEKVIQARNQVAAAQEKGDVGALGAAEAGLRGVLGQLFAVVESYPQLKADKTFMNLSDRISQLENAISDRREMYNESVNLLNSRLEQFPDSLVASWGSFPPREYLSFGQGEMKDVDVKALFKS